MGYGVYIFFATMLVGASIYAWFFIRETKGLRMDQMDVLFGFTRPGTEYVVKVVEDEELQVGDKAKQEGSTRIEVV